MTAVIPAGVTTARDLVSPAISAAVDRLSPEIRAVAAYHLGFVDAQVKEGRYSNASEVVREALRRFEQD